MKFPSTQRLPSSWLATAVGRRSLLGGAGLALLLSTSKAQTTTTPLTPVAASGYRGNRPRTVEELRTWYGGAPAEQALEPALPIVDPHHHLFGQAGDTQHYRLEDFERDLTSGHRIIGTVWVEAYGDGWRTSGPEALRSLGEVERVMRDIRQRRDSPLLRNVAAGMVSNVDLTLGDRVEEILDLHIEASDGRLRGARHHASYDAGPIARFIPASRPGLLADPGFRRGVACLARQGLGLDALVFHTQIPEVADLADALPDAPIVLNHLGQIIGVEQYAGRRREVFDTWRADIQELALRPNVRVKLGGMGMPMFGFGFETQAAPATSARLAQAWQPYIDVCLEAFGAQRCMFESNFPVDSQSCGYTELWNAFKRASRSLSEDERRQLFYRTACRTYRLPELESLGDEAWLSR